MNPTHVVLFTNQATHDTTTQLAPRDCKTLYVLLASPDFEGRFAEVMKKQFEAAPDVKNLLLALPSSNLDDRTHKALQLISTAVPHEVRRNLELLAVDDEKVKEEWEAIEFGAKPDGTPLKVVGNTRTLCEACNFASSATTHERQPASVAAAASGDEERE